MGNYTEGVLPKFSKKFSTDLVKESNYHTFAIVKNYFLYFIKNYTMSLQAKYQGVLNLGEELGATDGSVSEANGVLTIGGTVSCEYEKNLLWDKIKEIGGATPTDVQANIQVATTDYYAKYVVQKGDTLGTIAKHFYGEPLKYTQIFKANLDVLEHPDRIQDGQELVIPFEQ